MYKRQAVYHRVTDFFLPDDVLACTVDSRWVLVDTRTKRILRQPPEELHMPFGRAPEKELDVSLRKAPAQAVGQERATYTRCDVNRHLHNTPVSYTHLDRRRRIAVQPELCLSGARHLHPGNRAADVQL